MQEPTASASENQHPTRTRRYLVRALALMGGLVLVLMAVAIFGALRAKAEFAKVRPEALRLADEFVACALVDDEVCMKRVSRWDEATVEKSRRLREAVRHRLGKRGTSKLEEKSLRYLRNRSLGKGLRWRVQFMLNTPYERDSKATEAFVLEDTGEGLKVSRVNWNSDLLIVP